MTIHQTFADAVTAASAALEANQSLDQVLLLPVEVDLGTATVRPEGATLVIRCRALMPTDWHIVTRDNEASVLLNNAMTLALAGSDGVALSAVWHPISVAQEMLEAGERILLAQAIPLPERPELRDLVRDIYIAMVRAEPPMPDIDEDSVEEVELEFQGAFLSEAETNALRELFVAIRSDGTPYFDVVVGLGQLAARLEA